MTVYRAFEMNGARMKGKGVFETTICDGPFFIDRHPGRQNANRISVSTGVLYYWYAILIEPPLPRQPPVVVANHGWMLAS